MAFTSLNHYLDAEWLEYAFECTRKDGAVGVDGQTAESYAANLQQNLASLTERLKSGRYRAPPVRRHYIPKAGGGERGLGVLYRHSRTKWRNGRLRCYWSRFMSRRFLTALSAIGRRVVRTKRCKSYTPGSWGSKAIGCSEVDIRKYFDSIPFAVLRDCLAEEESPMVWSEKLIDKWLKAGVLESGQVHYPSRYAARRCDLTDLKQRLSSLRDRSMVRRASTLPLRDPGAGALLR